MQAGTACATPRHSKKNQKKCLISEIIIISLYISVENVLKKSKRKIMVICISSIGVDMTARAWILEREAAWLEVVGGVGGQRCQQSFGRERQDFALNFNKTGNGKPIFFNPTFCSINRSFAAPETKTRISAGEIPRD